MERGWYEAGFALYVGALTASLHEAWYTHAVSRTRKE